MLSVVIVVKIAFDPVFEVIVLDENSRQIAAPLGLLYTSCSLRICLTDSSHAHARPHM